MEAAIVRCGIFTLTLGTHDEIGHAGAFPIIWERADHSETRSAQGARDERIQVTRIFAIHEFLNALVAYRHVRRDRSDGSFAVKAGADLELRLTQRRDVTYAHVLDFAWKRDHFRKVALEPVALDGIALNFYDDTSRGIKHPAGKAQIEGEPVHGGTTADPLENSSQGNVFAYPLISGRRRACETFQDLTLGTR
jgi:hypothetical protein